MPQNRPYREITIHTTYYYCSHIPFQRVYIQKKNLVPWGTKMRKKTNMRSLTESAYVAYQKHQQPLRPKKTNSNRLAGRVLYQRAECQVSDCHLNQEACPTIKIKGGVPLSSTSCSPGTSAICTGATSAARTGIASAAAASASSELANSAASS